MRRRSFPARGDQLRTAPPGPGRGGADLGGAPGTYAGARSAFRIVPVRDKVRNFHHHLRDGALYVPSRPEPLPRKTKGFG